jgi:hypothetical protein
MNKTPDGERETIITGNFVVTHNLTDKRGITITEYITNHDDKASINAKVDEAMDVIDRQFIRADISTKEAQIANMVGNLDVVSQGYEEIIARRDSGGKLTSVEKERIKKYDHDVRGINKAIDFNKAAIAAARKKLEQ